MIIWWMKLGGSLPLGHDALLFSKSGTGSFICPYTAGQTKAFIYPVMNHWVMVSYIIYITNEFQLFA